MVWAVPRSGKKPYLAAARSYGWDGFSLFLAFEPLPWEFFFAGPFDTEQGA